MTITNFQRDSLADRYPFSDWLDGATWEIRERIDYQCATSDIRADLYKVAKIFGIRVRTKRIMEAGNQVGLYVQACQLNGDPIQPS